MATGINQFLECPEDCEEGLLYGPIDEDQDCIDYAQELSEVSDLYMIPTGAPDMFAAFATTPTYVADSIDNTVSDNSAGKWLVGIGEVPAADKVQTPYPKGKQKTTERTYALTFTVFNMSDLQYTFLQQVQCGGTGFTFYFADLGDSVYGKQGGIEPSFVDVDFPKASGQTRRAVITLQWKAKGDPFRKINPFAA
jgi:hypothetical protein